MPPVIAAVSAVIGAVGAAATAVVGTLGLAGVASSLGLSAFGLLTTIGTIGASLLKGGKSTQPSPENVNRLRANIDVRTPRKTVIGTTAMATDIRDEEFTGAQDYMHRFIVCASHKVQSIREIWFDDKMAWSQSGGVQGEFVGYLTVAPILEGGAGNAINISARMGASRRYTGLTYVHLRYKLTGNTNKVSSPFAQSITTRITIVGDGAALYDPRKDSTVPGGSGPQRADNQSTWVWDATACNNPALALLFYLLGYSINGELAVGKGIPADRIDLESFAIAANICDEMVAATGGGTERRCKVSGLWSEGDSPTTVIDTLKASMNADLDDVGGKLRVTVFVDDTFTSDADFTADDIIGQFDWQQTRPLNDSFNIVRGSRTDPSPASLYQQVDYPEVSLASADGIDRIDTLSLPMVESVGQCQRLAKLRLNRQIYGGTFKAEFQATAWRVAKNSIVRLSFPPLGFVNKTFRVAEMELRVDGIVPLTLVEEDPAIYVAPALQFGVTAIDATPYDTSLNPIIDALSAPIIIISATTQIVTYDAGGSLSPAIQDNVFSIERQSTTATCNWTLKDSLGNTLSPSTYLSATTGDSITMTGAQFGAAIAVNGASGVRVTATVIDGITITETVNVYKLQAGSNALVGFLTNADVTLAATTSGVVSSFATATGAFKVYLGTSDVSASCTFAEVLETNCTGTTNAASGVYSITALSADNGSYAMSATYPGASPIQQVFTLSKARAGATGATGTQGPPGTSGAPGRATMVYNQSATPSSGMIEGDLWYNTASLRWYRYTSGAWLILQGAVSALDIVTNAYIGVAAIGSANIGNLEVNTAHIQNLTIGTGKIAEGAISSYLLLSGGTATGNGAYQTILSGNITLVNDAFVFGIFTAAQSYTGASKAYQCNLSIGGFTLGDAGAGSSEYSSSIITSGSILMPAGTHAVTVIWLGQDANVSLSDGSLLVAGFMK